MENKIILGFDVGTHKIGVAIGQTLLKQAKPLEKIITHQRGLADEKKILQLIKEWRPHVLIVGMPTHMDGSPQFTTQLAKDFIAFLKKLTGLPVYEADERLTTKMARSEIFEADGYQKLKKANVDSYAAKLIVESWMNEFNIEKI